VHHLALVGEAARAVGHQAAALRGADALTKVRLAGETTVTFAAFRRVERDDVIARSERTHAGPYFHDYAGAFVPQDGGEETFGIIPREREEVGVTHARGLELDEDFARLGSLEIELHDFE
jgi:hypothetical protein